MNGGPFARDDAQRFLPAAARLHHQHLGAEPGAERRRGDAQARRERACARPMRSSNSGCSSAPSELGASHRGVAGRGRGATGDRSQAPGTARPPAGSAAPRQSRQLDVGHPARTRSAGREQIFEIYGVGPADFRRHLRGLSSNAFIPTIASASATRSRTRCSPAGAFRLEERIVRPNGEIRHLQSTGEVIRDERGEAGADARHLPGRHRAQDRRNRAARKRGTIPPAGRQRPRLRHLACSTRTADIMQLECRRRPHQAVRRRRNSRPAISAGSTPTRIAPAASRERALEIAAKRQVRGRRLAGAQGRQPVLGQRGDRSDPRRRTARWSVSPRSRATSPSGARRRPRSTRPARSWRRRRRWKRSASSPAASRTTSTTC